MKINGFFIKLIKKRQLCSVLLKSTWEAGEHSRSEETLHYVVSRFPLHFFRGQNRAHSRLLYMLNIVIIIIILFLFICFLLFWQTCAFQQYSELIRGCIFRSSDFAYFVRLM